MVKRVGILGGISHESTIEYYDLLHRKYFERKRDCYYPEIVVFSLNFQHFTDFEDIGDNDGYIRYIMEGIACLERAGVDFIVMAANSPHAVFDELAKLARVPMLSIVKVVTEAAKQAGMRKLLLLAVRFTVESLVYQKTCEESGMKVIVPSSEEQDEVNRIVFEELTIGVFRNESKSKLLEIIENYEVDGVILGCTELPLVVKQEDTNKKLFDTVELHAGAALEYALSS